MKPQIISFHCVMKNSLGQVINSSFNNDVINWVSGECEEELPAFSAGLQGVIAGERRKIEVKADDAYGFYDPAMVREATRRSLKLSGDLAVGDRVHLADAFGDFRLYRVTRILGDLIYLDANHPLAGQDLVFEVHVMEARDATAEEIAESSEPAIQRILH